MVISQIFAIILNPFLSLCKDRHCQSNAYSHISVTLLSFIVLKVTKDILLKLYNSKIVSKKGEVEKKQRITNQQ